MWEKLCVTWRSPTIVGLAAFTSGLLAQLL